jgi:DNA-directed RNA polymerase subunit N (RpoN/RPB10)
MIIPVRCFTCGKEIASKWEPYRKMKAEGKPINEIWNELGITRFCCKRMLVSHVNLIDDILKFPRLQ